MSPFGTTEIWVEAAPHERVSKVCPLVQPLVLCMPRKSTHKMSEQDNYLFDTDSFDTEVHLYLQVYCAGSEAKEGLVSWIFLILIYSILQSVNPA